MLERQRKDGSISPENLALLTEARDAEKLDRDMHERRNPVHPTSTPRAPTREAAPPKKEVAPPPAWAAKRMGTQGGTPDTMGGSEKKLLQARRSRGEISSVDLARCVHRFCFELVLVLPRSTLPCLYGSMRFRCTLLSAQCAEIFLASASAYARKISSTGVPLSSHKKPPTP